MNRVEPVLVIDDLTIEIGSDGMKTRVVESVHLSVRPGEALGIVGESGCGKTMTMLGALGLLPHGARVISGRSLFKGTDLLRLPRRSLRSVRGYDIGMVFQDPLTSLHPAMRVGDQIIEGLRVHEKHLGRPEARERAVQLLARVGVPKAAVRMDEYPHQWSGGMRQRAMIALAIAHGPALIIADEPTTALDVTVQAEILELLAEARTETETALIFISHDFGVVAEVADRVAVMYAGHVVEEGSVRDLFASPLHPYTVGLMSSVPRLEDPPGMLRGIPGQPPQLKEAARGCPFEPRCRLGRGNHACVTSVPPLRGSADRRVACHLAYDSTGG